MTNLLPMPTPPKPMVAKRETEIIISSYTHITDNYIHRISLTTQGKGNRHLIVRHILHNDKTEFARYWHYTPDYYDRGLQHYLWLLNTQFNNEPKGGVTMKT